MLLRKISPKIFMGFMCGIIASIFWGFHTVVIRYLVLDGVSSTNVAILRLLIGSLFLHVAFLLKNLFKRSARHFQIRNLYFWIAVFALAANFLLFHMGLRFTIASDAILLETFSPVIVLFLILYFVPERLKNLLKNPKMVSTFMFIVLIGSIGASFILLNDPKDLLLDRDLKLKGDLIEFAAMFFFGIFMFANYEYQRRTNASALSTIALLFFFAAIIIAPFGSWSSVLTIKPEHWILILLLGVVSTGLAYVFWQLAAKSLEAVPLALLYFSLASVLNVGIESLVFNIKLSPKLIVGGLLILSAAIATQILLRREQEEEKKVEQIPPATR